MDVVIDKMKDSTRIDGRHGKGKCGFFPDKMMVPKAFSDDARTWTKWKEDVRDKCDRVVESGDCYVNDFGCGYKCFDEVCSKK